MCVTRLSFVSFPVVTDFVGLFAYCAMNSSAHGERKSLKLCCADLLLQVDDIAGDKPECDLRGNKPPPVDALVQNGTYDAKYRREQACPHQGGKKSRRENRPFRKHGKHCAVEQSDQQGRKGMNPKCGKKSLHVKLRQELIALVCPAHKSARGHQVRRVPQAVILDQAV